MAGYLRYYDYLRLIQDLSLKQLITNDDNNRILTEKAAQAEMISYLAQKYDVPRIFTETVVYDPTSAYQANQLVELNFPAYDATKTYTAGVDVVSNGTDQYMCKNNSASPAGTFVANDWTKLGSKYDLYYINPPFPSFDIYGKYETGDRVWWKGKVYECKQATSIPDHAGVLQYDEISAIPYYNTFPDDKKNGPQVWGAGVSYTLQNLNPNAKASSFTAWSNVTSYTPGDRVSYNGQIFEALAANTNVAPGSDIAKWQPELWILGDNRNPQLVQKMCYITIYHLCTRIPTRSIPTTWDDRYHDTIDWLREARNGLIIADLPLIQTAPQNITSYGGAVKNKNRY